MKNTAPRTAGKHSIGGRALPAAAACVLAILVSLSLVAFPARRACAAASEWTIMVYLDADCNLEKYGVENFIDMAASAEVGPGPNNVNVLVQMDRFTGGGGYEGWTDTKRFEVLRGSTPVESDPGFVSDLGEQDMGDPATLVDFVSWARSYRPAERYMLVLWNHGGGWIGVRPANRYGGVCYDDTNSGDFLDMKAMNTALSTITDEGRDQLDLLTFDACLMGMAELDDLARPYCKVRTASEETIPGNGIPYLTIIADLVAAPTMDEKQLASDIVDRYYQSYHDGQEYAAVDLSMSEDIAISVGALTDYLIPRWESYYSAIWAAAYAGQHFYYWDYIDLYTFAEILGYQTADGKLKSLCRGVMKSVTAELLNEKHGASWPGAHGVSVYFPYSRADYSKDYDATARNVSFSDSTHWDRFLKAFLQGPATNLAASANGGKVVASSADQGAGSGPEKVIDAGGDCWVADNSRPDNFVTIELAGGAPVPLGTVMIDPGPRRNQTYVSKFHLDSSLDGQTFKTILEGTFNEESLNRLNPFDLNGSGESARFLRLVIDAGADPATAGVDVGEVQVYRGTAQGARTFYFAEGTTRPDFETYFSIGNPAASAASVRITYLKGDGTKELQRLSVPASSRATVHPADILGSGDDVAHDFSAIVESTNGVPIVAERPTYFDYRGEWDGGHDVVGATALDLNWYFAEGTTRPGFDAYLSLCNPGDRPASVAATYFKGDGTSARQVVSVPAGSRRTLHPADVLGVGDDSSHDFSVKVESTNGIGIVAERPMYFDYQGKWTGGSDVVGANAPGADWYFAEGTCRPGFDPYICVQNPGDSVADVHVTYMKGNGTTQSQAVAVAAGSRYTIGVRCVLGTGDDPAHDFAARVSCTNGAIICERPMYFDYGGLWNGGNDAMGATGASGTVFFAEGTTRPGFDAYLSVQNPGDEAVAVTATYLKGDGGTASQSVAVAAGSRATLHPADVLGEGTGAAHDFSARVTCGPGGRIVVERSMYFDFGGWTGGSAVVGFGQ